MHKNHKYLACHVENVKQPLQTYIIRPLKDYAKDLEKKNEKGQGFGT